MYTTVAGDGGQQAEPEIYSHGAFSNDQRITRNSRPKQARGRGCIAAAWADVGWPDIERRADRLAEAEAAATAAPSASADLEPGMPPTPELARAAGRLLRELGEVLDDTGRARRNRLASSTPPRRRQLIKTIQNPENASTLATRYEERRRRWAAAPDYGKRSRLREGNQLGTKAARLENSRIPARPQTSRSSFKSGASSSTQALSLSR